MMKVYSAALTLLMCSVGPILGQSRTAFDNVLPNVQNQLASGISWITKQKSAGTGPQSAVSCSGFEAGSTSNNQPTLLCPNTGEIKADDLVVPNIASFWGFPGPGYLTCRQVMCNQNYITAARVVRVSTNQSITIQGNLGGVSPTTDSNILLTPIAPGDVGTRVGMDGWTKSAKLLISPDDFSENWYPGTIRPLLLRKGEDESQNEVYQWEVPINKLDLFRGRIVTCEMAVWQKVQGATGTWQVFVKDNVTGRFGRKGKGRSAAGYEVLTASHPIAPTATSIVMGLNLLGTTGDVYYMAGPPTCAFADTLSPDQMHMNSNMKIQANGHWNPPLLTPYLIQFVDSDACAPGLYCKKAIDLEAISFGTVHKTVNSVDAKIEWTTHNVNAAIFTGTEIDHLTFSLEAHTQVPGVTIDTLGTLDLYKDGTFILFTNVGTFTPDSATFDFWNAYFRL